MTGYYNNLALHISDATLKARRRLDTDRSSLGSHLLGAAIGAAALWALLLVLI